MRGADTFHILYIMDDFLKFMQAKIVDSKHPEEIIKTFNDGWIESVPDLPSIGIFSDNGGEFKNKDLANFSQN